MFFNALIQLTEISESTNGLGDVIENRTEREVYANKKAIRQSEFYQAAVIGLKPEIAFEVRAVEYNGEEFLKHDGKEYKIIRTFSKNFETIELVCTGLSGAAV